MTTRRENRDDHYVEVIQDKDGKVVKRMGPMTESKATKVCDGVSINVDQENYSVRITRQRRNDKRSHPTLEVPWYVAATKPPEVCCDGPNGRVELATVHESAEADPLLDAKNHAQLMALAPEMARVLRFIDKHLNPRSDGAKGYEAKIWIGAGKLSGGALIDDTAVCITDDVDVVVDEKTIGALVNELAAKLPVVPG